MASRALKPGWLGVPCRGRTMGVVTTSLTLGKLPRKCRERSMSPRTLQGMRCPWYLPSFVTLMRMLSMMSGDSSLAVVIGRGSWSSTNSSPPSGCWYRSGTREDRRFPTWEKLWSSPSVISQVYFAPSEEPSTPSTASTAVVEGVEAVEGSTEGFFLTGGRRVVRELRRDSAMMVLQASIPARGIGNAGEKWSARYSRPHHPASVIYAHHRTSAAGYQPNQRLYDTQPGDLCKVKSVAR